MVSLNPIRQVRGRVAPADDDGFLVVKIGDLWARLKREPAYFWLLCAYLFFEYVRPQSAYPEIDFLPWAKLTILGALVTRLLAKEKISVDNPLTFTSVGFFFAALVSSVFAEYPAISFDRFVIFVNWLILYLLFLWIVTTRFRLFTVVLLLLLASFKMSQHAAKSWLMRGLTFEHYGISGGIGSFGNSADLGVQMLIFIALALALVTACHSRWGLLKKGFFCLMPLTGLMTVVATGERGTALGLAVMGLSVVLVGKHKIQKFLLLAIVGFAVLHVMPDEFKARFETIGTDGTSQARLRYWKRGIEIYSEHPVLGIGFNNWVPYYSAHYPGESLRRDHQEVAHSTPITVLAEMGTIGFLFFYGMALWVLLTNITTMRTSRQMGERFWHHLAFALNIGLIGFLGASFFVTQHEYPFLFVQTALSAALYNVVGRRSGSSVQQGRLKIRNPVTAGVS